MADFFGGVREAFERFTGLSTSTCGKLQKDSTGKVDVSHLHIFTFQAATEAEVGNEAARSTQRAVRLFHDGRIEEALREFHDAKQLASSSVPACNNLGCAYHLSGDDNASLFWYREAFRLAQSRNETAIMALALLEQRRGQVEEAQRLLVNFLQDVDAAHVGVLKQLAALHREEGHFSKAAGCYHRLISVDPTNNEWPAQLQACLDQVPVKDAQGQPVQSPGAFATSFARAFSFAEPIVRNAAPANEDEALAATRQSARASALAFGSQPASAPRQHNGGAIGASGHPAAPSSRPCFATSPHAASLEEARRQHRAGRPEVALELYKKILHQDSRNSFALLGLVDCFEDLGNLDHALEAGKQLLATRPDDAEANLRVSELLLVSGCGSEMAEPYLKAVNTNGDRALQRRLLCARAELLLGREEYPQAMEQAAEAVRVDAESPRALMLLGIARLRIAEYGGAQRALTAALEAAQESDGQGGGLGVSRRTMALIYALIGEAHERLRQYPQALAKVQSALEIWPALGKAKVVRAMVLHHSGRAQEAEAELQAVLRQDPRNAVAKLQLGYALLSRAETKAIPILEGLVTGAGVSNAAGLGSTSTRSELGAAKVYLAMAYHTSGDGGGHPEKIRQLVTDALALHKNLRHVWAEIESRLAQNPTDAVQRLRGICDLDLTSVQARQLLLILAQTAGCVELVSVLRSTAMPSRPGRLSSGAGGGASSRAPSLPPSRWAPTGPSFTSRVPSSPLAASSASTTQHMLNGGYHGGCGYASTGTPSTCATPALSSIALPAGQAAAKNWRGRSTSPSCSGSFAGGYLADSGGYPSQQSVGLGGSRYRGVSRQSREPSPMSAAGDAFVLDLNECLQPEELVIGPQLGAGGSAQVFRGTLRNREVAIKKISGVAHLEEMRKEINALRALRHPRLVAFIGACVQPPLLMVVTEFMAGGSLHDRLFGSRNHSPLAPVQQWTICMHVLEGLAFLHSRRVVHRDLKSMNILLDTSQNAKICDFGLAHPMEDKTHIARKLDGEGGSPRYMAPECYDPAHGKLTEKVDIWAFGCICIEIFGGTLPYAECSTMAQLSARILVERRPPGIPNRVPNHIAPLIQRCLNFVAVRRPHASELHSELARQRPM